MIIEVQVPQLSESVAEATLSTWHVKEGDAVARDQNLIDIETDKVVLELPAPGAGVIVKIIKQNGESVASGEVIAHIDTEAKASAAAPPAAAKPAAAPAAAPAPAASATAMPAARKIMDEKGISAADVQGSGRGGRILKEDVSGAAKPAAACAGRRVASADFCGEARIAAAQRGQCRRDHRRPSGRARADDPHSPPASPSA
jgi:2-oxoglutarate dehydrogenase E2 component (dihydrolipoamide succinyltransferase)